ncbi:hypothetical protein ACFO5R_02650 [Halosolutus amylolyticus]|uniref:Uncharacterized protein n=1 Tax=Halosolutus amylolyticus TaxID=2932267 RepID=A0ABD5PJT1_9EURY|nr:hypothetical protein [Halosolutus amylolyticus]
MSTHVDVSIKEDEKSVDEFWKAGERVDDSREVEKSLDELRTAKITRTEEQGVIGVPVFFTLEHLERQGIDPTETDHIVVRIEKGFILFEPLDRDD